jgi:KUP system potassium uptake protein
MRRSSITRIARCSHWLERLFAFMQRNSVHVGDFLHLPPEAVVEIGRQVSM